MPTVSQTLGICPCPQGVDIQEEQAVNKQTKCLIILNSNKILWRKQNKWEKGKRVVGTTK